MDNTEVRQRVLQAILALEASMAQYAIYSLDDEFVERWEVARNEYLSLLTWLKETR